MKRILIFIGLKIAEILSVCGIIGIMYGIGYFILNITEKTVVWYEALAIGFMVVLIGAVLYLILSEAIKANWKWAGRLSK